MTETRIFEILLLVFTLGILAALHSIKRDLEDIREVALELARPRREFERSLRENR